ncbi:MAG: hypothetical protein IKD04_05485 [Clostridia bacterium]|nr:hypothetical protein [Clostridia bacterium]
MITVKEIAEFKDYGKCVSISNGTIEAYVTVDIGPRIIKFGFVDGQNFMCDNRAELGCKDDSPYTEFFGEGRKWESFGGHRIWLSPESYPETYTPDDKPVKYMITESGALFIPEEDVEIGVAKTLELKMAEDGTDMQVIMRVKNIEKTEKEFSIWGLSVCSQNGTLIVPMNTNDTGLLSNRIISVWPYTDMSSDRIYWGKKYVTLRQDPAAKAPVKLGFDLNCGTAYYVMGDEILRKVYETKHPEAKYPDGGCSFETYTNAAMLEFETLSELKTVAYGEESELVENWSLLKKPCEVDLRNDASIDEMIEKL